MPLIQGQALSCTLHAQCDKTCHNFIYIIHVAYMRQYNYNLVLLIIRKGNCGMLVCMHRHLAQLHNTTTEALFYIMGNPQVDADGINGSHTCTCQAILACPMSKLVKLRHITLFNKSPSSTHAAGNRKIQLHASRSPGTYMQSKQSRDMHIQCSDLQGLHACIIANCKCTVAGRWLVPQYQPTGFGTYWAT